MQRSLAFVGLEVGVQHAHALVQLAIGRRAVDAHGVGTGLAGLGQGFELGALCPQARAAQQGGRTGQVERQAQDAGALQWAKGRHGMGSPLSAIY